jgi:hypothetical protein
MLSRKFHRIFTTVIVLAAFCFYACPTKEEEPESPPDYAALANEALAVGNAAFLAATSDGGTFTTSSSGAQVKFKLSGLDLSALPDDTGLMITNITIKDSSNPLNMPLGKTSSNVSMALGIDKFIIPNNGSGTIGPSDITIGYKGVSTVEPSASSSPDNYTVESGSVAGTINALRAAAAPFLPAGGTINNDASKVVNLYSGSIGTVSRSAALTYPIINTDGITVTLGNPGGSLVANGSLDFGTIQIGAGSFTIGSASLVDSQLEGMLAIEVAGSGAVGAGSVGTGLVLFGDSTTSPTEAKSLVLTAEGIKYIVPQFGVLVTVYR